MASDQAQSHCNQFIQNVQQFVMTGKHRLCDDEIDVEIKMQIEILLNTRKM